MEELREYFGLSEYEAKIYLCLIKAGPLGARKIGLIAGIPRTKVYAALRRLIDMGVVVERPQTPRTYIPTPPVKAFRDYLKDYEIKAKNLSSVISSLEKTFSERTWNNVFENGVIWVIRGERMIFEKMEDMLAKARDSVEIETNEEGSVLLYTRFHRLFDRLSKRSVQIQLSTRFGNLNRYVVEQFRHVLKSVNSNIRLPLIAVNVDNRHFLIAILERVDLLGCVARIAIFTNNQILARVVIFLIRSQGN